MRRILLPLLLPALTRSYWPTTRGETNLGCASQRLGPADLLSAASTALSPPLAASQAQPPCPLISPSGTLYVTASGPTLLALAGDTLDVLATLPLPPAAAAAPLGVQLLPDGTLWVNGLGLLEGNTLKLRQGSALEAVVAASGAAGTLVVTLEACDDSVYKCLVVRSLAQGGATLTVCTSSPQNFAAVLSSFRADDATAYLVMQDTPEAGSALVALNLSSCDTATGVSACVGGVRTAMAPFFSSLLVDICSSSAGVQAAVLSATGALAELYPVAPSVPGYEGACVGAAAAFALYTEPSQQHAVLVLSCALQPQASGSPPQPFLLAFDLSAQPSAAQQLWAAPLPQGHTAPLAGLAIDRAGTVFAAAAPHGAGGLFGGLLAFSAATGQQLMATPCCAGTDCPDCGLYSQPAIGLDGTLYALVMSDQLWQGVVTFQRPPPPALSPAARSDLQHVLVVVGALVGVLALCGVGWAAQKHCRSSLRPSHAMDEEELLAPLHAPPVAAGGAGAGAGAGGLGVAALRAQLSALGVSHAHCLEKAELIDLLRQSQGSGAGAASSRGFSQPLPPQQQQQPQAGAHAPRFLRSFKS